VKSGYWRANGSSTFYRCLRPTHCLGGDSDCNDNRAGPLCAVCAEGYTPSSFTGGCTECPSQTKAWWSSILILLALFIVFIALYYVALRGGEPRPVERISPLDIEVSIISSDRDKLDAQVARLSQETRESPNIMFNLKIALSFLQIFTRLLDVVDSRWPSYFETFLGYIGVVNFDFVPWETVSCITPIDFYTKLLSMMLIAPVALLLISLGLYVAMLFADRQDMADDNTQRNRRAHYRRLLWRIILFTLFLVYPSMSAKSLSMFVCNDVEGVDYLVSDFTLECFDSTWHTYMPYAVVGILVYPVGIPLLFYGLLHHHRNSLKDENVVYAFGFLYKAFCEDLYFFELVDMVFKLLMTSVLAFLPSMWQLPYAMVVAGLYSILILLRSPYIRTHDDRIHLLALIEMILLCMCGYILQQPQDFDYAIDVALSVIFIGLTIAVVLLFIYHGVLYVRNEMQERARLKAKLTRGASLSRMSSRSRISSRASVATDAQSLSEAADRTSEADAQEGCELAELGDDDAPVGSTESTEFMNEEEPEEEFQGELELTALGFPASKL